MELIPLHFQFSRLRSFTFKALGQLLSGSLWQSRSKWRESPSDFCFHDCSCLRRTSDPRHLKVQISRVVYGRCSHPLSGYSILCWPRNLSSQWVSNGTSGAKFGLICAFKPSLGPNQLEELNSNIWRPCKWRGSIRRVKMRWHLWIIANYVSVPIRWPNNFYTHHHHDQNFDFKLLPPNLRVAENHPCDLGHYRTLSHLGHHLPIPCHISMQTYRRRVGFNVWGSSYIMHWQQPNTLWFWDLEFFDRCCHSFLVG